MGNINFDWEPYRMRAIPVGYAANWGCGCNSTATISLSRIYRIWHHSIFSSWRDLFVPLLV